MTASLCVELEVILKAAADLAESTCIRDHRQHTIISQSGALKAQLQGLVTAGESQSMQSQDEWQEDRREAARLTRRHSTTLKQEVRK